MYGAPTFNVTRCNYNNISKVEKEHTEGEILVRPGEREGKVMPGEPVLISLSTVLCSLFCYHSWLNIAGYECAREFRYLTNTCNT